VRVSQSKTRTVPQRQQLSALCQPIQRSVNVEMPSQGKG
jgi:hypothetical protein